MWDYDEWKSKDFFSGKRKITKAMFMAVAIHCEIVLYNMLYNSKECAEAKEDLTIDNAMSQLNAMCWKLFGEKNVETIDFKKFSLMVSETQEAILSGNKRYINGATFSADNGCVCRSQWVELKDDKSLKLYSIHVNTESGEAKKQMEQLWNLAYQVYVMRNAGTKVSEAVILFVDNQYRKPKYGQDAQAVFTTLNVTKLVDALVSGIPYVDEDEVVYGQISVKDILDRVNNVVDLIQLPLDELEAEEPKCEMNKMCLEPFECPCYGYCKKKMSCEDSIVFKIGGLRKDKKFKLINAGYRDAEDLLFAVESGAITLSTKQVRQLTYEVDKHKIESLKDSKMPYAGLPNHIERGNLEKWFDDAFPADVRKIYFLDFETFQFAIPIWQDLAPYEKVPFQFSLHIYDRDTKELAHEQFLARKGKDPRRTCAKLLCKWIPMGATSVAFNRGFEKSVCHKLAENFPDLAEHLNSIADGLEDLMIPFQQHWYYKKEFSGKYSIKFVLPGLFPTDPTLDYHNLEEIQNGVMAMSGYLKIQMAKRRDAYETRKHMYSYCALDTFAMVKIFWYLEKLILCGFDEEITDKEMDISYAGYAAEMDGLLPKVAENNSSIQVA